MITPQYTVKTTTLNAFIRNAKAQKVKRLTREREYELIREAQAGSEEAADEIMTSHIPLVIHIAKNLASSNATNDEIIDLIQQGAQALPIALTKFRFSRSNDARFGTYAGFWIRKFVRQAMLKHITPFSISDHDYRIRKRIQDAIEEFENEHGRSPNFQEIAAKASLTTDDVKRRMFDLQQAPIHENTQAIDEGLPADVKQQDEEAQILLERKTIKQLYERLQASTTEPERAMCVFLLRYMEFKPREVMEIMELSHANHTHYVDSIQRAYLDINPSYGKSTR